MHSCDMHPSSGRAFDVSSLIGGVQLGNDSNLKNRFQVNRKTSRHLPVEYFLLANVRFDGATIGYLAGKPIREVAIDADGAEYHFAGVATRDASGRFDVCALRQGEWIVQPGLVYVAGGTADRAKAMPRAA